jgi:hypothetical protein
MRARKMNNERIMALLSARFFTALLNPRTHQLLLPRYPPFAQWGRRPSR